MGKIFKNRKSVIILAFGFLIFFLVSAPVFADKLQFGGFALKNNPVNTRDGEKMEISGTVFYFTILQEPKPLTVSITIAGEIYLPAEISMVDERIIDQETNNKMQEWAFSAAWDGKVPFMKSSSEVYDCLIKVSTDSTAAGSVQKNIRLGVVKIDDPQQDKDQ